MSVRFKRHYKHVRYLENWNKFLKCEIASVNGLQLNFNQLLTQLNIQGSHTVHSCLLICLENEIFQANNEVSSNSLLLRFQVMFNLKKVGMAENLRHAQLGSPQHKVVITSSPSQVGQLRRITCFFDFVFIKRQA